MASFVAFGVKELLFDIVPDMCSPTQKAGLVCPNLHVFFSSGILWSVTIPFLVFFFGFKGNRD